MDPRKKARLEAAGFRFGHAADFLDLTEAERRGSAVTTVFGDILAARKFGVVRCALSVQHSPSIQDLANEFELHNDPDYYQEIEESDARRLAFRVLSRDLAYDSVVMENASAQVLTDRFFAEFHIDTRFFTNGTWFIPRTDQPHGVVQGAGWNAVTSATFDTGVLLIGPTSSGCLWVEDED